MQALNRVLLKEQNDRGQPTLNLQGCASLLLRRELQRVLRHQVEVQDVLNLLKKT